MEPFGQAHNALTREQSGTGLGLPISASLAELNGGRLTVTSVRDVGTTVSVILPVNPPADRFDPDKIDPDAELEEPVGAAVD
jgi:signal transduction histidine kinase